MKNNIRIKLAISALFIVTVSGIYAQNAKDVAIITKDYDMAALQRMEKFYAKKAQTEKAKAIAAAKKNNWPVFKTNADGSVDELMKLTPDGFPLYYSVSNVNAAISTRANILQSIYGLLGEGMVARIWDGGKVRASHQEFTTNRVSVIDDVAWAYR
ncbi:hypothetical protein [Flavobacterium sp. 3HN19-14]|uniref:hypothetical protein n=1 Tax=Flavobacterium sp. 3HN19-14 TaxID=3448133 RepID=UPI003EE3CA3E